jgi:hypothetical protein
MPAHTVFHEGTFWLQITLGRIFHQQAFLLTLFPPLTVTMALLSTFELGVLKAIITTFLSFITLLTLLSQSITGYEPNIVASGVSDTAAVVFVFDRSKDHFDEPKPFSVF